MTSRIYVAIDTSDLDRAKALAKAVKRHAGGIKLGLEFFAANGPAGVADLAHEGMPIFLDLKLHDIPNTVAKAVQALRGLDPAILTVHAAGGRAMLEEAKACAPTSTKVVARRAQLELLALDHAWAGDEEEGLIKPDGFAVKVHDWPLAERIDDCHRCPIPKAILWREGGGE